MLTLSSGISGPDSVATDAAGDVFVANAGILDNFGDSTVEEFSPAGALLWTQTLSSGISDPVSVATDAAGDVFVANQGNYTVEEFSAAGALLRTLSSGINDPVSVATDAAGDVFVANQGNNTVEEFDAGTTVAATSPITLGGFTTYSAILDTAMIAPFEAVIVSDSIPYDQVSATISFAAANGTLSGSSLSAGVVSGGTATYSLSATTAAALQAELGALRFTPTQGAGGATVTTAFDVTVSDVTVSDVTASPPTTPSATLSSGIDNPNSVATDAAGNVFVANQGNNTVEEFSAAGALVRTLSNGISGPDSVATDAAGDVFVANYLNSTVEEFSSAGALVQTLSSGISIPFSVATDAAGDVFVANAGNNTVDNTTAVNVSIAPTITGTVANQATTSEAPISPFAGVTIGDTNAGATDMLTIELFGPGKLADVATSGDLTKLSLKQGPGLPTSAYSLSTLSGSPDTITSELDALVFTPVNGTPNTSVTTGFTLIDDSSAGTEATDATTTVIDTDPALPTIMGTVAGQATTSEATVMPFAGVTIGDTNAGATDMLTIELFGPGKLADVATPGDLTKLSLKQGSEVADLGLLFEHFERLP